jgi:hypothetical protein
VLLVPRQLQRSGMTGAVPYYGGRFTPAQAFAAAHPQQAAATQARPDPRVALQHLLDTGVITEAEHAQLVARLGL